jgi:hypothetical protein
MPVVKEDDAMPVVNQHEALQVAGSLELQGVKVST